MGSQVGERGVYIVTARHWDGSGTKIIGCFDVEAEAHNIVAAVNAVGGSMDMKVIPMPLNLVLPAEL